MAPLVPALLVLIPPLTAPPRPPLVTTLTRLPRDLSFLHYAQHMMGTLLLGLARGRGAGGGVGVWSHQL